MISRNLLYIWMMWFLTTGVGMQATVMYEDDLVTYNNSMQEYDAMDAYADGAENYAGAHKEAFFEVPLWIKSLSMTMIMKYVAFCDYLNTWWSWLKQRWYGEQTPTTVSVEEHDIQQT